MNFTRAIVRPPSKTFAAGLTTSGLGQPDLGEAVRQHGQYCAALERCGLTLTRLPPVDEFPDSTFVEDPAIVAANTAILTRPGAKSRLGEVALIEPTLRKFFSRIARIEAPGTVDGGDVFQAEDHFFIGITKRTNEEGARQLAEIFAAEGFTSSTVDVRGRSKVLHLRTGASYLGDNRFVASPEFADHPAFAKFEVIVVSPEESYAANLLRLNDHVIVAAGFPKIAKTVRDLGYATIVLDMSEFRKMDGSLTCPSVRF